MIGKSVEEIIQRWNQEHPDNKIKIKNNKMHLIDSGMIYILDKSDVLQ